MLDTPALRRFYRLRRSQGSEGDPQTRRLVPPATVRPDRPTPCTRRTPTPSPSTRPGRSTPTPAKRSRPAVRFGAAHPAVAATVDRVGRRHDRVDVVRPLADRRRTGPARCRPVRLRRRRPGRRLRPRQPGHLAGRPPDRRGVADRRRRARPRVDDPPRRRQFRTRHTSTCGPARRASSPPPASSSPPGARPPHPTAAPTVGDRPRRRRRPVRAPPSPSPAPTATAWSSRSSNTAPVSPGSPPPSRRPGRSGAGCRWSPTRSSPRRSSPSSRRARVTVDPVGASDHARACGTFVDLLAAGRLAHRSQAVLDDAVAGAARRPLGDAWLWSRCPLDRRHLTARRRHPRGVARPSSRADRAPGGNRYRGASQRIFRRRLHGPRPDRPHPWYHPTRFRGSCGNVAPCSRVL